MIVKIFDCGFKLLYMSMDYTYYKVPPFVVAELNLKFHRHLIRPAYRAE